ncbi:unnamed protein product [Brassica rapa subsp. trilocularis]
MKALIIPEECDHIISISPRDLPGYPRETLWHCYCRRPSGPKSRNLLTRVGEDITVFDPQGNDVESPREEWFIEEISLPPSVADTDLVFCQEWFIEEISLSPSVIATSIIFGVMVVDVKPKRPRSVMVW